MITIRPDGTVETLQGHLELPGQVLSRRRASHILPVSRTKRLVFRLLRLAGDETRGAAWTRTWRCQWQADLRPVQGPVVSGFDTRAAAIAYEINWIERNGIN